jgi:hypothetical protein
MRVFKRVSSRLDQIEVTGSPGGNDPSQNITDLAQGGLVERTGAEQARLTVFGQTVLAEWHRLDVANEVDEDDLPRCLVVVQEAMNFSLEFYARMRAFWAELRKLYDADDLLGSPEALYVVSYLNQEVGGYNPWRSIRANHLNGGVVGEPPDWTRIESQIPNPDGPVHQAIEALSDRIGAAATRATGRISFCRAMELAALEPDDARQALERWGIGEHAQEACLKLLPTSIRSLAVDPNQIESVTELILERWNVVLYGPPGTGKTVTALAVAAEWERRFGRQSVFQVTFHPSYSYEDFVQGFRPKDDPADEFELRPGILLQAVDRAMEQQQTAEAGTEPNRVLVILDEINRGDTSRIFGELISYIEADKRGLPFRLAQSPAKEFIVPRNLYFLGTMNTADKSISLLDVALRRRFAFWSFEPDYEIFARIPSWESVIENIELGALLRSINSRLLAQDIEPDRAIGQAVLKIPAGSAEPLNELRKRVRFDVWPLVAEYCYIDRSKIRAVLGDLVDEAGNLLDLSDESFKEALVSLTTPAVVEPVTDEAIEEMLEESEDFVEEGT